MLVINLNCSKIIILKWEKTEIKDTYGIIAFCIFMLQALQKEIAALQNEISTMNEASQRLMSAAGSESRNLIQQTVGDLNERLESLEKQARIKESMLQQRNEEWKQYQVSTGSQRPQFINIYNELTLWNSMKLKWNWSQKGIFYLGPDFERNNCLE